MSNDSISLAPVPHGVMFHHFHGAAHPPGQGSIGEDDFRRILEYVGPERILAPDEWLVRLEEGRLGSGDVCLTFDDGLLAQYEIALPVMDRLGLKAFWFVYSSVFEGGLGHFEIYRAFRSRCFRSMEEFYGRFFETVRRMAGSGREAEVKPEWVAAVRASFPFYTAADIRYRLLRDRVLGEAVFNQIMDAMMIEQGVTAGELADGLWMTAAHLRSLTDRGHHVGLHSYSHPMRLGALSPAEQRSEYHRNFDHLKRVCGVPTAVAHPVNSYTTVTLHILADLGIGCGFRSTMTAVAPGAPLNGSSLELAREDHSNLLRQIAALQ